VSRSQARATRRMSLRIWIGGGENESCSEVRASVDVACCWWAVVENGEGDARAELLPRSMMPSPLETTARDFADAFPPRTKRSHQARRGGTATISRYQWTTEPLEVLAVVEGGGDDVVAAAATAAAPTRKHDRTIINPPSACLQDSSTRL